MSKIQSVSGRGLPLQGADIDTDRIIPARYLRCVTFDGLGEHVFEDDRTQAGGEHPFDISAYQEAEILVVNANFGCGSSREHAPQAIARWGISALVGESFAEIFFGNCVAMGVPCVTAPAEVVERIQQEIATAPQLELTVDLETMQVRWGDKYAAVEMGKGPRQMFLSGTWDACGQLLANLDATRSVAAGLPYTRWNAAS
ncbi:MAG: 3-isopropylmalate dehydratase small subunit [Cyanobacteria bacterium P01_D01_bin.123]